MLAHSLFIAQFNGSKIKKNSAEIENANFELVVF